MRLLLLHPELPTCGDCQRFVYDPTDGWRRSERGGRPTPRESGQPPPCGSCPKVPRGRTPHPAHAVELTDDNYQAWVHYQRCKAVGRFPADAIVERNAGLLRTVEEQVAREERARSVRAMLAVVTSAALLRGTR